MKTQSNKLSVLLLLIAVFAAPGIAAYVFYQHPTWLGTTKVNKGTLLQPPVEVNALSGQAKWRIIFWTPNTCDKHCLQQLDTLARVRLALGRKLYQVEQWLILGEQAPSLSPTAQAVVNELDFHVGQLPVAEVNAQGTLFSEAKIFIADPNKYLILSYNASANPDDVYKDLKLLLNTTEKNG